MREERAGAQIIVWFPIYFFSDIYGREYDISKLLGGDKTFRVRSVHPASP